MAAEHSLVSIILSWRILKPETVSMPEQWPRGVRINANAHSTIVREDGTLVFGLLVDLSENGFCLASDHALEINERVEIRVEGLGQLAGIVRWAVGGRAGGVLEPYSCGAFDDT